MEKTDIRVRFTQKVLKDSLLALMKEKSILHISIKEICEAAGLSRSTFYTYYNDQYDLLREIEEQTHIEADKIVQSHIRLARKSRNRDNLSILHDILQYIADNSNSIQVLLSENGDRAFQKKFIRHGIEGSSQFIAAVGVKPENEKVYRYSFVFLVSGILALVQEWLKNGMDTPVPELAKMLSKLTREVLR
jgi:AcrR family transcriptional regulator